jgi:anaerobic selenocysteine-containing dehydrogenase
VSNKDQPDGTEVSLSRRKFLKYCAGAVLATASYHIVSVFGDNPPAAGDDMIIACRGCIKTCQSQCLKSGDGPCVVVRGLWGLGKA